MQSAAEVISEVDSAFAECPKPERFGNYEHCEECAEHDRLLRDRTRGTLRIEDVGNVGWDPISFSDPPGLAYYFPALARLAISSPTYEYGWYGDLLLMHLTYQGSDNRFLRMCSGKQRQAVSRLLEHLQKSLPNRLPGGVEPLMETSDFVEARALWSGR